MEQIDILLSIGGVIVVASIVAIIVTYSRMQYITRQYLRRCKYKYEDEYGLVYERLNNSIHYYGTLLLVGFIVIALRYVFAK